MLALKIKASVCMRAYVGSKIGDRAVVCRGTNTRVALINTVNPNVLESSMCMRGRRRGESGKNSTSTHSVQSTVIHGPHTALFSITAKFKKIIE